MNLPATIKVGGIQFKIVIDGDLRDSEGNKLDGWARPSKSEILIQSGLNPQYARVVLIHEILHTILVASGRYPKEAVVDTVAYGIVQVLQENPLLVGAILEEQLANVS